jgi:hypothetical protein
VIGAASSTSCAPSHESGPVQHQTSPPDAPQSLRGPTAAAVFAASRAARCRRVVAVHVLSSDLDACPAGAQASWHHATAWQTTRMRQTQSKLGSEKSVKFRTGRVSSPRATRRSTKRWPSCTSARAIGLPVRRNYLVGRLKLSRKTRRTARLPAIRAIVIATRCDLWPRRHAASIDAGHRGGPITTWTRNAPLHNTISKFYSLDPVHLRRAVFRVALSSCEMQSTHPCANECLDLQPHMISYPALRSESWTIRV